MVVKSLMDYLKIREQNGRAMIFFLIFLELYGRTFSSSFRFVIGFVESDPLVVRAIITNERVFVFTHTQKNEFSKSYDCSYLTKSAF